MLKKKPVSGAQTDQNPDGVSDWLPEEFIHRAMDKKLKWLMDESESSFQEKNLVEKEKERLQDIFDRKEAESGEYARLLMHLSVLSGSHQKNVNAWEPTTISYIPMEEVVNEFEEQFVPEYVEIEPEPETIEQDEYLHLKDEAEQFLAQAREEAERMILAAQNEVESIQQTARQEAYTEAKLEAQGILETANQVLAETNQWRSSVLRQSEESIINLLQLISSKLFGEGFVLEPEFVEKMVVRAITEASRLGNLRVYLNPLDEEKLVSLWHESDLIVNGQKIQLVSSPGIEPGGCFIEGEYGSVDSRIGMQLELIQSEIRQLLFSQEENPA